MLAPALYHIIDYSMCMHKLKFFFFFSRECRLLGRKDNEVVYNERSEP